MAAAKTVIRLTLRQIYFKTFNLILYLTLTRRLLNRLITRLRLLPPKIRNHNKNLHRISPLLLVLLVLPEQHKVLKKQKQGSAGPAASFSGESKPSSIDSPKQLLAHISTIPALQSLLISDQEANLLCSSAVQLLTESETVAYRVAVRKHLFPRHILLHYEITNTIKEQLLKDVTVELGITSAAPEQYADGFKVETVIGGSPCGYNESTVVFAAVFRPFFSSPDSLSDALSATENKMPTASFWNTLHFKVHQVDSQTGEADPDGFADEYPLDELEMTVGDYNRSSPILPNPNAFNDSWAKAETSGFKESVSTFAWSTVNTLQEGISELVRLLGLAPVEGTDKIPSGANKHILCLTGTFVEGGGVVPVLAEVRMRQANGVQMKLSVRSPVEIVANVVANAIFQ